MTFKIGDKVKLKKDIPHTQVDWDHGEVIAVTCSGIEVYWEIAQCPYVEDPDDLIPYTE